MSTPDAGGLPLLGGFDPSALFLCRERNPFATKQLCACGPGTDRTCAFDRPFVSSAEADPTAGERETPSTKWEDHMGCSRTVEGQTVHYSCGVSVDRGEPGQRIAYEGGVYAEHIRRATRPATPDAGDDVPGGRMIDALTDEDITDEWNLSCENGHTLRDALTLHGLPVSGTKRQQARRLIAAGVTREHVREHHDWRARRQSPRVPCATPDAGDASGDVPRPVLDVAPCGCHHPKVAGCEHDASTSASEPLVPIEECIDPDDLLEAMIHAGAWAVIEASMDTADREPGRALYDQTVSDVRDWLAAREAKARAEAGEQIAQAIEALRLVCPDHSIPDCSPLLNGCSVLVRLHARRAEDARIAREVTS